MHKYRFGGLLPGVHFELQFAGILALDKSAAPIMVQSDYTESGQTPYIQCMEFGMALQTPYITIGGGYLISKIYHRSTKIIR